MRRLAVERSNILCHRLRVNRLAERLPRVSFTEAAFAGLQDSAPRAAIVALHARLEHVAHDDWEHPSLVQTWAPRGAVFVVPRTDLAVFALGIAPRDPEVRAAMHLLAAQARRAVPEPRAKGGEAALLGPIAAPVAAHLRRRPIHRLVFAFAGVPVRWDASKTYVLPSRELEMDEEDARRELARRFLRSLAPAGPLQFTRWAAVSTGDAQATFAALGDELVEVEWAGGTGFVLADDADDLTAAQPVAGVRFIPFGGDPVLQPGDDVVLAEGAHSRAALPPWASVGLVLADGRVVAAWGRSRGRITLLPLTRLGPASKVAIEEEAVTMPFPDVTRAEVTWREA